MIINKTYLLILCCFMLFNISKAQMSYVVNPINDNVHLYEHNDYNMFKKKIRYQQDTMDNRGLVYGMSVGAFKANAYNAMYYNGATNNENNLRYILSNPYHYNEIRDQLRRDYDSTAVQPPTSMTYDMSYMIGFFVRYNFKRNLGIFINFNYSKINTTGQFALQTDSFTGTSQKTLLLYPIIGVEQRTYIDVGFQKQIAIGDKANFFYEGGLNFSSTSVKTSEIMIGNLTYSLVNVYLNQPYSQGTQQSTYNVYQGGVGFGFFAGAGISLIFSSNISVDPGFDIYYQKIGLTGYPDYKLNYNVYVRFVMRNLF